MIQTIVERIYIVDKDDERYCHIFIKGCSGEDYTGFFQTAGYIEQKTTPVCDSEQYCLFDQIFQDLDRVAGGTFANLIAAALPTGQARRGPLGI